MCEGMRAQRGTRDGPGIVASQLLLLLLAVSCLPGPGRRRRRRLLLLLLLLLLWLARSVVLVVREGMGIRKMCARAVRSGFFF